MINFSYPAAFAASKEQRNPHCGKTLFKRRGQLYCAKEGCGFVKNIEKTNAEK